MRVAYLVFKTRMFLFILNGLDLYISLRASLCDGLQVRDLVDTR